jgi:GH35 family endo-1,4-beta-xylanase
LAYHFALPPLATSPTFQNNKSGTFESTFNMLVSSILISLLASWAVASSTKRQQQQPTGLDALAKKRGKYIGTATNSFNVLDGTPGGAYLEILRREFKGAFTAENEGKWDAIHPTLDYYNYTGMDAVSRLIPLFR